MIDYKLREDNYGLNKGTVLKYVECPNLYMPEYKDGVSNTHRFTPEQMVDKIFEPVLEDRYYSMSEIGTMGVPQTTIQYRFYVSKEPEKFGVEKIGGQKMVSASNLEKMWLNAKKNK